MCLPLRKSWAHPCLGILTTTIVSVLFRFQSEGSDVGLLSHLPLWHGSTVGVVSGFALMENSHMDLIFKVFTTILWLIGFLLVAGKWPNNYAKVINVTGRQLAVIKPSCICATNVAQMQGNVTQKSLKQFLCDVYFICKESLLQIFTCLISFAR